MKVCQSFLLHIDTHLQTCQLYYKPIVHEHKSLSFLFFTFFSTWEREGVYNWYREKQSKSLLILFRWISVENISSFTGQQTLLFLVPAWRYGFFLSELLFVFLYPEPHLFTTTSVQRLTFFLPTSADRKELPLPPLGSSQSFGFSLLLLPGQAIR